MKFDDITVGMVYPIQYGNHNLLSISYRDFLKDIIIEKYNSNDGMKCPEVIRIIVKMAQCKDHGTYIDHIGTNQ